MRVLPALLILGLAAPAAAQEPEIRAADLPREVESRLLRTFETAARRVDGGGRIGSDEVVRGDLVGMGGPLGIAGMVEGGVVVVNGDVVLEPGGRVLGGVTVVRGDVRLEEGGRVDGTITTYGADPDGRRRDRRRRPDDERERGDWDDWDPWPDWSGWDEEWDWPRRGDRADRGYSRLTVRPGESYNRVEGLPVMFGPRIQTAGANPVRLEALAIWRTEAGTLDADRMGYRVRAEHFLGGNREVGIGASLYSVVQSLDRWQLTDLESSLAAVLFHDDYRDHFDRTGWSAFFRARPTRWLEGRVELRAEDHASVAAGDPWSLFHGDDSWRLQPLVAEGDVRSIRGTVTLDLRDDDDEPTRGWFARAMVERPVGGELSRPALMAVLPERESPFMDQPIPTAIGERPMSLDFTTGFIDLRRYHRVGYGSQLTYRVLAAGSLGEEGLPPQFQHTLGGPGSLPGFPTFLADCGVRSGAGTRGDDRFFPAYGCDQVALGQVEYRGSLSLDFGLGGWGHDYDDRDDFHVDLDPTWVAFFDAGHGWAHDDPALGSDRDTGMLYDLGLGFLFDDVGIYAALPLNGEFEQKPRFFVRLVRRF